MDIRRRLIGVLGGMGPQASCELYRLINSISISDFGVKVNADFPHLLIDNIPVSDLIKDDAAKEATIHRVADEARRLCAIGVTDLLMCCNTMHIYWDQIAGGLPCNAPSLVDIVADTALNKHKRKAFVLGTNTTIESGLYQTALEKRGITYVTSARNLQDETVGCILKFIAGSLTTEEKKAYVMHAEAEISRYEDVDIVILACTELPIFVPSNICKGIDQISSLSELAIYICALANPTPNLPQINL